MQSPSFSPICQSVAVYSASFVVYDCCLCPLSVVCPVIAHFASVDQFPKYRQVFIFVILHKRHIVCLWHKPRSSVHRLLVEIRFLSTRKLAEKRISPSFYYEERTCVSSAFCGSVVD